MFASPLRAQSRSSQPLTEGRQCGQCRHSNKRPMGVHFEFTFKQNGSASSSRKMLRYLSRGQPKASTAILAQVPCQFMERVLRWLGLVVICPIASESSPSSFHSRLSAGYISRSGHPLAFFSPAKDWESHLPRGTPCDTVRMGNVWIGEVMGTDGKSECQPAFVLLINGKERQECLVWHSA